MSRTATDHRAEVDGLTSEFAGLEALSARHQTVVDEAARKHRAGKATADDLQAAHSAAAAVKYALDQTRADLEAARAALAEAESAAEDEVHLAAIARATVEYTEAEREHREILDATEHALSRAITRSAALMRAASNAKNRASKAAHVLAEKHTTDRDAMYARAVNGSEAAPLRANANVTKWPFGNRQRYRILSQVKPTTQGVAVGEAEASA